MGDLVDQYRDDPASPILARAPKGENRETRDFHFLKEVTTIQKGQPFGRKNKSPGFRWDIGKNHGHPPNLPPLVCRVGEAGLRDTTPQCQHGGGEVTSRKDTRATLRTSGARPNALARRPPAPRALALAPNTGPHRQEREGTRHPP